MRIPRIYTSADLQANTKIELEPEAAHYLTKVLRFKEGASIILFNGRGGQFNANITLIHKKHLEVQLHHFDNIDHESPLHIHLGIAVSRGERMDYIMQKTTELGISEITPLFSERTELKLKGSRLEKKLHHWNSIIINACEQCGRNRLPRLNSTEHLSNWITSIQAEKKFVLHHRTTTPLEAQVPINSVALLIGPEGGLSQTEIEKAQSQTFTTLSLGPRVLRTETAPLAAISLLQHYWGDM